MRTLAAVLLCITLFSCQSAARKPEPPETLRLAKTQTPAERARSEASGKWQIVSTQGIASTQAAREMLERGGNLIDAAIAASFTLCVERPHSTGIGGGGFMMVRDGKSGKILAIDFRERAPARARRNMFLDARGGVVPGLSTDGILAVAVPGMVAGLTEIHAKFGKLPLSQVMAPAIRLAETGFPIYPDLANALEDRKNILARFHDSRGTFLKQDGKPYRLGELLVQKDLARTLRKIAAGGAHEFYGGETARAIVRESKRDHGLLSGKDLRSYSVKWREPVRGTFLGYEIDSMPPPSSGGAHVIQVLNILEDLDFHHLDPQSASYIHWGASALQLAFADRSRFMGDPDFVRIPLSLLLSKGYASSLRATIDPARARPSSEILPGALLPHESDHTTHFSMMDSDGNVVASTQTINGWMGSAVVAQGTGIVLNNEMDDFSAKPGASNQFGAIGGDANSIVPGKTPLSSMSPTIVLRDGAPVMAVGAPGGTKIISCVAETLLNHLGFGLPLYESVAAIRFHHQWKPDELTIDAPGPRAEELARLGAMGHTVVIGRVPCYVMAVSREADALHGVSDPRDIGTSYGR